MESVSKLNFEERQIWLDNIIKLNSQTSLFYFIEINNFLNEYAGNLGIKRLAYMEKQFYFSLDLKLLDWAEKLFNGIAEHFDKNEPKIRRMLADYVQIKQTKLVDLENLSPLEVSLNSYKELIKENQNDQTSLKMYFGLLKSTVSVDDLRTLIDFLNEYLKVYMDDVDVWNELAELYISTLNYNKAIFCLEEVLLHYPNNFEIYIKIGDLLNSFNNTESAGPALKYYSKSILLKPTPRAFWGIIQIGNIYSKFKKPLDDNLKKLIKISIINLKNSYSISMIEALTSQIKLN